MDMGQILSELRGSDRLPHDGLHFWIRLQILNIMIMKKILSLTIVASIAAATLLSCSKEDFSGSDGDVTDSLGPYMMTIANDLIVDNLKVLEYVIRQASPESSEVSFDPTYRLTGSHGGKGVRRQHLDRIQQESGLQHQWHQLPDRLRIQARMLPGAGKEFHDWSVSIKGSRQEKNGYSCDFGTNKDSLTYLIGWSEYSWGSCQGKLNMIVYKDGKPIDSIVMTLLGGRNDYSLSRTY